MAAQKGTTRLEMQVPPIRSEWISRSALQQEL